MIFLSERYDDAVDRAGWLAATGITQGRGGEDHRSRVYPGTPMSLAKPQDRAQRSGSPKQKHRAELEESPGRTRQPCGKNEPSLWSYTAGERRKNKPQFHVDLKEDVSDEIPRHGKRDTEREAQGRCSPHTGCGSVRVDQEAVGRSLRQNRHSQKLMN